MIGSEENYFANMKECQKECGKPTPSQKHLMYILQVSSLFWGRHKQLEPCTTLFVHLHAFLFLVFVQETFARRTDQKLAMDKRGERMVSTLLKDFPCLEYAPFILEETRLIMGKKEKEFERLFQSAKNSTAVLMKMIPTDQLKRQVSARLFSSWSWSGSISWHEKNNNRKLSTIFPSVSSFYAWPAIHSLFFFSGRASDT